jgi:hypothetical protein
MLHGSAILCNKNCRNFEYGVTCHHLTADKQTF